MTLEQNIFLAKRDLVKNICRLVNHLSQIIKNKYFEHLYCK